MSEDLVSDSKTEEIRGLFVLGLLAVLIAVKLQTTTFIISIGDLHQDAMPLLDLTFTLWSLYAFFMVLGLSEDILGKSVGSSFRVLAKSMLRMNFLFLFVFGAIYGYVAYPTRLPWVIGLILVLSVPLLIMRHSKRRKSIKKTKKELEFRKEEVSSLILLISVVVIMFYPEDWIRLPIFVIGIISIIGYFIWHKEKKVEAPIIDDCGPN